MNEKLKKELGFLDIFSIASGAMISSGLFILPSLAYKKCGPGVFLAYILAGLFVLPAMLSKAELSTAMPRAGGTYFFIDRSLGPPMGTLGGISNWFSLSLKSAFALVGLGIFFQLLTPHISYLQVKLIASAFLFFFILLNIMGAKETGKAQVGMVLLLIGLLIFYVLGGLPKVQGIRYFPIVPKDMRTLFSTAGFVFISYGGLTKIASVAEEVKNPGRTIPFAMITAWLVVGLLYAGVVFVTVGLLEPEVLSSTHTPISLGAKSFAGTPGLLLLSFAGILAFLSTANAGILSASRSPMAMARDNLVPPFFSRINRKFKTPHYSIISTGLFMFVVIAFLDLEHLVEVASALMILLFVLENISVIVMRESKMPNYRPKFKAPFYPWLQILGILGPLFLLLEFGFFPLLITILFLLGGCIWYGVYARPKVSRESGLMYIVQRLLSRHLSKGILGRELREIIRERDEIVEDRFDRLIHSCPILDFERSITLDEFFKEASQALSKRTNTDEDTLYVLLWERERESSTVIGPGLAIPHIVIPGEKTFDILLARCKEGIIFNRDTSPVTTVFLLLGTRDERNFHLKTLAAIAQIAQDKEFEQNWLKARTTEELRDIILLAERKRFTLE
ncbi:MAG TPA: amino acid permease [Candidatus Omnitrophica bacterium]|nr:amino acid permease [Candidatus Omnitrophota bacterium]